MSTELERRISDSLDVEGVFIISSSSWADSVGSGIQVQFSNGYGASVIRQPMTKPESNFFELAVLNVTGDIIYTTPITGDVVSYQSPDEIMALVARIASL